jgi:transcriptional regulator with XRE-family HTH domain
MTTDYAAYARAVGRRLRAARKSQGLSLHGVENASGGRLGAAVVGTYERGSRNVTVQKLAELAEFYGVPVPELLPGDAAKPDAGKLLLALGEKLGVRLAVQAAGDE